jgi:hypothetical protein
MIRNVSRAKKFSRPNVATTVVSGCIVALLMSAASNSQSIPPGDSWKVPLSKGGTFSFGGTAAQLCATPNAFIPASRMRFWKETTVMDNFKEIAATYIIYAPYVKGPVTILTNQELPLVQGDGVLVYACGCVQTHGTGKTWKSYVHPKGNDSDHLYSGTIQFLQGPVTSNFLSKPTGMEKIADFVNAQPTHGTFNVQNAVTILSLGYLDDHYSDNGYDAHDDGNDDQCKNVGPVALEIAIFHAPTRPLPPL